VRAVVVGLVAVVMLPAMLWAQDDPHAGMQHDMAAAGWTFMQDGLVFAMYNDQGSARGEREFKIPNWWMGMAERPVAKGRLTINLMLSLDPATVGAQGYSHILQVGETYEGNALIDHQHPHDFLMQAAAIWRRPLGKATLIVAGAPVGEPALGPIAFMHRSSAAENPMSPLGHHTLDSTHIAMGVITAGLDTGRYQVESSVFHGAEPDENRWDLMDPGPLDSWSVRGWYRPTAAWTFQVSHGYLTQPEAIEEGDVRRTTASAAWLHDPGARSTAVTLAWGRNEKLGGSYDAYLGELTKNFSWGAVFGRAEVTQVETDVLRSGVHTFQGGRKSSHVVEPGRRDFVGAVSLGSTKTLWKPRGWDVAAGGMLTGYVTPASLSPFYGQNPWSFQIFGRVRIPSMHRMLDMTMTATDTHR